MSPSFARPLNKSERKAFLSRQDRLKGQFGESASDATKVMKVLYGAPGRLQKNGFRVRTQFSRLDIPHVSPDSSDRKAPPRSVRPPATMIQNSQGCALRFYLTALALAQVLHQPGQRFTLSMPLAAFGSERGWSELLASKAVRTGMGNFGSQIRDKKARSLREALDTLEEAGLVDIPEPKGSRRNYSHFSFLHEAGKYNLGDPIPYTVPKDSYFTLPIGFILNGWIHVLEDSEITLLLMVACGWDTLNPLSKGANLHDGEVAISAEDRLGRYGIHRDVFSTARKTLEGFGLIDVREVDRHHDGKAEKGETSLHRLSLNVKGFEESALEVVLEAIQEQLQRTT